MTKQLEIFFNRKRGMTTTNKPKRFFQQVAHVIDRGAEDLKNRTRRFFDKLPKF